MAVSAGTRHRVLARDNYTCRYCGAFAPMVTLHVDHVMPRKLGGSDKLTNLVTACRDCNLGKSASPPDPDFAAEVRNMTIQWLQEKTTGRTEDDLSGMSVYQESLAVLTALPAYQVIHCIARAFAAALPYRPDLQQVVRAAAGIAAQESLLDGSAS